MYPKNNQFFILLFFTELWERFSFYGMRALLVLFLTSSLGFADKQAYAIYSLFAALCYAGPVIGGIIADKFLGFRNIIKLGAVLISAGNIGMIMISENNIWILYLSLSLVAVGSGMFKGNLTNLLGMCYSHNDSKRDSAFSLFYVSVNLGAFVSSLSCAFIAEQYGWHYGFAIAAAGMLIGFITFIKFEYLLENVGILSKERVEFNKKYNIGILVILLLILLTGICAFMISKSELFSKVVFVVGVLVYGYLIKMIMNMNKKERNNIILLLTLTIFMMLFFSIEMQLGSLYNLFTARNVETVLFGFSLPAASLQSINPISIMFFGPMLAPLFTKLGVKFSILRVGIGMLLLTISLGILYFGCLCADENSKVPIIYLVSSITVMGIGELFIAPLVTDLYTRLSPKEIRGFMMGLLMLSLSFSNLMGNIIALFVSVDTSNGEVNLNQSLRIYQDGFGQFTLCSVIVLIIFTIIFPIMNKQYLSNFKN